jgi:GNAT superfamily N-acetyltransferase
MTAGLIRPFDMDTDAAAVARLDTSFTTRRIFKVERGDPGVSLDSVPIEAPIEKRFPLGLDDDPWKFGWVVMDGDALAGFIATATEEWNKRLVIWHFYVDRPRRRDGFGRQLIEHAVAHGASAGMMTAWVETSNLNYPGVQAYGRLGFDICGFDLTLYRGTPSHREFALYLARPINLAVAMSDV